MAQWMSDEDIERLTAAVERGARRGVLPALAIAGFAVVTIWLAPMLLLAGSGGWLGFALLILVLVALGSGWTIVLRRAR